MSANESPPTPPLSRHEWLSVLGLVLFIGLLFYSTSMTTRRHPAHRIHCISNLKQVELGLKSFANDHNDQYPWQISTSEGGVMEWVGTRKTFLLFGAMSNEISSPKVLLCPSDAERQPCTSFLTPGLSNLNLSYFIGLNARDKGPLAPVFGDRNLAVSGYQLANGTYYIPTQKVVTWSSNIHVNAGNMAFSDGSANMMNNQKLQNAFNGLGRATNIIAIP